MKKLLSFNLLFFLLLLFTVSACGGDDENGGDAFTSTSLVGSWKAKSTYFKDLENGEEISRSESELYNLRWSFQENGSLIISEDGSQPRSFSYTYNASSKDLTFSSGNDSHTIKVNKLTNTELVVKFAHPDEIMEYTFRKE